MSRLRAVAASWLIAGRRTVLVEVSEARGSAPRETGTRMLVSLQHTAGTVGGGHLELKAIDEARAMLADERFEPHERHYPLGPALGQCCGGAVTLRFAALDAAELERWPVDAPRFHLQLYGAGHVGRAIVRALAPLHVQVDWIDERESEFPAGFFEHAPQLPWPDHIRKVCVDAVEAEVQLAPPGAFYLVLTHQHDLDLRISEAILKRADFGFFGLIGSRTKRARFIHRFEQRGIAAEAIARMTCPIGLPGIEGKEPEVIAAGVVAQLLAHRPSAGVRPAKGRTAEDELDRHESLQRIKAARKEDPKFKRAIAEVVAAEARHAKSDPVEGAVVHAAEPGPAQSLVRSMLSRG